MQIQSDERKMFSWKENKYSLIIKKCELDDSGEYKVILRNSFGETHSKCLLNVLAGFFDEETEFSSNKGPCFVELIKDSSIKIGQDVCIKCKITGIPQPDLKWYKDGDPIKESKNIKVGLKYRFIED